MERIYLINTMIISTALLIILSSCKKKNNDDSNDNFDSFPPVTTLTDIDGNIYNAVTIGTQVWMKENLKVTHYRNGDPIPKVVDNITWSNLTTGSYCYPENDINNVYAYGILYNWYAISDIRNLAPSGWHVASDVEWTILVNYLGGESIAGGKLKENGTTHWVDPNIGATNESGFTALPAGYRGENGGFYRYTTYGCWWSSNEYDSSKAWKQWIFNDDVVFVKNYKPKHYGFSVRCVKD